MLRKTIRIDRLSVFAGLMAVAAQAQTLIFMGVVSDSVNGMQIDSVTVTAGIASTMTKAKAKGEFTLVTSGTPLGFWARKTSCRFANRMPWIRRGGLPGIGSASGRAAGPCPPRP